MQNHRFFWGKVLNYGEQDPWAEYPELIEGLGGLLLKHTPQHVTLQGLPGTGKSSGVLHLASKTRLIYLDINEISRLGGDGYYREFAERVRSAVGALEPGDTPWLSIVNTLGQLEAEKRTTVIALDHFDRFAHLGTPQLLRGLLAELLGVMNKFRHVAVVFVSIRPLSQLCRFIDHMSELPERCNVIRLIGPEHRALQAMLARDLLASANSPIRNTDIENGLRSVGRNPSLAQMVGAALAEGTTNSQHLSSAVLNNARVLFDRVFEAYPLADWKALLRWKASPREASEADARATERFVEGLVYSPASAAFFSPLFEQYLNERLAEGPASVVFSGLHVSKPLALPKVEHSQFLVAACQGLGAYQINWKLAGEAAGGRVIYGVEPYSASGHLLRPFFLKIDQATAIEKEHKWAYHVRNLGVVTPPVYRIDVPGQGGQRGLKTEVASLSPQSRWETLRDFLTTSPSVSDLQEASCRTLKALAPLYEGTTTKERSINSAYRVYKSQLKNALELAHNSISDPFGVSFLRRCMPDPAEAMAAFEAFLNSRERLLSGPIHGDLHGRNVIRDESGNIQIIDFGRFQEDGHMVADFCRLELSLLFDFVSSTLDGGSSVDPLALLRSLVNMSDLGTVLIEKRPSSTLSAEGIVTAVRNAVIAAFPAVTPREYVVSLLSTLLVLLSFENYLTSTSRWVAYLYAWSLLGRLTNAEH